MSSFLGGGGGGGSGGFPPAVSNLTFYVDPGGSDSNPGTIGSPFKTIQRAVLVAENFNYQALYAPTINVTDVGLLTCKESNIQLGGLLNAGDFGRIIGSTPTFPIIDTLANAGNGYGFISNGGGGYSNWIVNNFEIHSNGSANSGATAFLAQRGSQLNVTGLIYKDPTNAGSGEIFQVESWAKIVATNLTIASTKFGVIAEISGYTTFAMGGIVTFPVTSTCNYMLISDGVSLITWNPGSTVNGAGVVCNVQQVSLNTFSALFTANGAISDIPGTGGLFADETCAILSTGSFTGWITNQPPVTKTANYSQVVGDQFLIFNGAASITLTLLSPAAHPGMKLNVKTIAAQTLVSASSNVVPLIGGAASTAILAATAGKWAELVSDGTNWNIMAAN